jgi:hypothetical protein
MDDQALADFLDVAAGEYDLLRASREADALGTDLLGSIHRHPDWHRRDSSLRAVVQPEELLHR